MKGIRFRAIVATAVAAVLWPQPASPQETGRALSVDARPDGRLMVRASGMPLDELVAAVAARGGIEVSVRGGLPHDRTTVVFENRWPDDILIELLDTAKMNYALSRGEGGRLVLVGASRSMAPAPPAPAPVATPAAVETTTPAVVDTPEPVHGETDVAQTQPAELPRAPGPDGSMDWPAGVPPIGAATSLPETREGLIRLATGGSSTTTSAAGVTPNGGRTPPVTEPITTARGGGTIGAPVMAPGVMIPGVRPSPNSVGSASAAPLPAPAIVEGPGPAIVWFPPPIKR